MTCDTIRDLLPLYAEDLTSEDSRKLVEEHLAECENCRRELAALREPSPPADVLPLLSVKKLLRRQNLAWGLIAAGLVAALLLTVVAWGTRAQGVSLKKENFRVLTTEEGTFVRIIAPEELKLRLDVRRYTDQQGRACAELTACTSPWLQLFGGDARDWDARIQIAETALDRVYYCDQKSGGVLILLYGETSPADPDGMLVLPRLVLNYYLLLAVVLTALFALLALVLRKKSFAPALGYTALGFGCYLGGHLLTMGFSGISHAPVQDLIFILLVGGSLFLLFLGILQLQKLSRSGIE